MQSGISAGTQRLQELLSSRISQEWLNFTQLCKGEACPGVQAAAWAAPFCRIWGLHRGEAAKPPGLGVSQGENPTFSSFPHGKGAGLTPGWAEVPWVCQP